jgi:hypothetical protein
MMMESLENDQTGKRKNNDKNPKWQKCRDSGSLYVAGRNVKWYSFSEKV